MISLSHWRNATLSPIDEACAVGTSARLSEAFDHLQQEVSKGLALEGESTDWRKVLTHSNDILATQSKDLLVLVYSMRAAIDAYRYEGFVEALLILQSYVDRYWVDSFPPLKRKRARVAAFEWLTQQLDTWVESNKPEQEERCFVESVLGSIKLVNQSISALGNEWHLDLFSVTRNLNGYLSNLSVDSSHLDGDRSSALSTEQPKADIVPINGASTHKPDAGALSSKPNLSPLSTPVHVNEQVGITDDKSYNQYIRTTQLSLKSLAKYRLSKDLADARAYEINRFSLWLPISELPLHQNGLTPLRSIPAEKRHFFDTLFQQRQYEILIIELESSLSNAPFWLDGHRLVVDSLKAIAAANGNNAVSDGHNNAIDMVSTLTKSFITRLAGIERLTFSDESPFADEETQSWLASVKSTNVEPTEKSSEAFSLQPITELSLPNKFDGEADVQAESKIIKDSNQAYKETGFLEGFLLLDQYCYGQTSKKSWFKARLLAIEYCFTAKEFVFAEQLLIELDEMTLTHKLDVWEPEMVGCMLSMMIICKSKLKRKKAEDNYYQRLVRVNTKQGYEMKSFAG